MKGFIALLMLVSASFSLARAEPLNFELLLGQTVLLNVLPVTGENNGAYYVGLTLGTITVDGTTSDPFYMFCNDINDTIHPPVSYNVVVRSLNPALFTPDNLGIPLAALQEQQQLGLNFGNSPSGNSEQDSDIQQDIWNLDPGGPFYSSDTNMANLAAAAEVSYLTADYNGDVFFDTTGPDQQSFIPVSTPEPKTLGLSGTMLLALGGLRRWRRLSA